jgi:quercetin dioxygenase-like cupin family protein
MLAMARWITAAAVVLALSTGGARADEAIKTTVLMNTATTNIGQPIVYPRHGTPEIATLIVEIPPGGSTELHRHPVPVVGYILEGQLEVRAAGGKVNRYKAGDSFVEALNHAHTGINVGPGPVRILVTVIGTRGVPYAVPAKE